MPKSSRQKLRILKLLQILEQKTDEGHLLTTAELIEELNRYGIEADRKTVYDDLQALEDAGYDLMRSKGKNGGVRLLSREFALSEVKMLVDAVQSSRFITEKKSKALIKKLSFFVSEYQSRALSRHFYNADRLKSDNPTLLYTVDTLNDAINENKMISFRYWNWNVEKQKVFRHGGKIYTLSPWELTVSDNNYYLIAYDEENEELRHFRVDKMAEVSLCEKLGAARKSTASLNLHDYCARHFGMFGGSLETVKIRAPLFLAGVFIDRFGKDVILQREDDRFLSLRVKVSPSPQFYGWLLGLGAEVSVLEPESVRSQYKALLKEALGNQEGEPPAVFLKL